MEDDLARQKSTIREVIYGFFNNNQMVVIEKHFNYNFSFRFNNYRLTGSIALLLLMKRFHALFPSTHIEITSIFSEGDMVCAQWKMLLKPKNSAKTLSTTGVTTFRFHSDKIVQAEQHWSVAPLQEAYLATEGQMEGLTQF